MNSRANYEFLARFRVRWDGVQGTHYTLHTTHLIPCNPWTMAIARIFFVLLPQLLLCVSHDISLLLWLIQTYAHADFTSLWDHNHICTSTICGCSKFCMYHSLWGHSWAAVACSAWVWPNENNKEEQVDDRVYSTSISDQSISTSGEVSHLASHPYAGLIQRKA